MLRSAETDDRPRFAISDDIGRTDEGKKNLRGGGTDADRRETGLFLIAEPTGIGDPRRRRKESLTLASQTFRRGRGPRAANSSVLTRGPFLFSNTC